MKKFIIACLFTPLLSMAATDGEIAIGSFILGTLVAQQPINIVVLRNETIKPVVIPREQHRSKYRYYPDSYFHGYCSSYYGRSYQECIFDARHYQLEMDEASR